MESGQALFDFRQLPLQSIHPLALPAARASLCAARQGKLWDFHDRLFAENADLTPQGLFQSAAAVDVDLLEWQACLNASTVNQEIERDVQTARRLGINSTPFFVVGVVAGDKIRFTGSVRGAKRAGDLSRAIDEALQMSTPQR